MANRKYITDGTSITVGGYYNYYLNVTGVPTDAPTSFAVNGSTVADIVGRAANVDVAYTAGVVNLLVIEAGANDFATGVAATDNATLASLQAYFDARRATGFKVIGCTCLPRGSAWGPNYVNFNTARNTNVNPALRSWVGSHLDGLIDWATDPIIGPDAAGNDVTLFGDALHPTLLGKSYMANLMYIALDEWLATVGKRQFHLT